MWSHSRLRSRCGEPARRDPLIPAPGHFDSAAAVSAAVFRATGERPSSTHAAQRRLPGAARARAGARHLLLLLLNVLLLKPRQSCGLAVLACGLAVLSPTLSLISRLRRAPVTVHLKTNRSSETKLCNKKQKIVQKTPKGTGTIKRIISNVRTSIVSVELEMQRSGGVGDRRGLDF